MGTPKIRGNFSRKKATDTTGKTPMKNIGKGAVNTIVGKGSVLEGAFEVHEGIRVDGTLKGRLVASGTLVVGPSGEVEADPIRVRDAVVAGRLAGKLEAEQQVKLEASATLIGDISAKVLIVEEGAVFRGFCEAGEADKKNLPADARKENPVEVHKAAG